MPPLLIQPSHGTVAISSWYTSWSRQYRDLIDLKICDEIEEDSVLHITHFGPSQKWLCGILVGH
jgi:hypothetical protein